jgi:hypothetical protein
MKFTPIAFSLMFLLFASIAQAQDLEQNPNTDAAAPNITTFHLVPNPSFVACLADSSGKMPKATVVVVRGRRNDLLTLTFHHVKPRLNFDLFTVQHSPFLANGSPDPAFVNFGLAWYQSDVHANVFGTTFLTIKTILLDQIFGFDPAASLAPTNTFHVGFWFNDPNDAVACGFDATNPTPFNGEHQAGPLAMISLPDATTGLGPLCTNPNTSTVPATCNP